MASIKTFFAPAREQRNAPPMSALTTYYLASIAKVLQILLLLWPGFGFVVPYCVFCVLCSLFGELCCGPECAFGVGFGFTGSFGQLQGIPFDSVFIGGPVLASA